MSNVPTNLIPTKITGLPEYVGSSTLGYLPYVLEGRTYRVQFANIAAVGAVPSTREINTGSGLGGGGDLSANRTLYILPGGVDDSRLTVTGVTAGTYGAADSVPVLTVNAQGRVTAATSVPIVLANYVPTSRTITAGAGLTGGGDLSANRSFAVNFSSTTPEPLGTGSSGVSTVAARGDHVHPAVDLSDTTETQGVLPLSRGGTGNSLSPVAGAIVYSSNDKLYLTTAGSVGQVLRSGGPGGVPFWTDVGAGTVISVAVATANGFAGTVVSPTLSPVITLSTTVTGLLKGDGTAVSAATAGVDYVQPGAYTASGLTMATARLLGRTTASVGAAQEITVGTGLTLASGSLVNAAPDQTVSLTGGTAISISGTYPSFTITNTAPDQVVSLTGAGTTTVTGTYPSFTITSNDSTAGTVTSVNASGGTTGMSFTGGPITSAGTLTLNGTLAVANGGTGATDAVAALTNLGAYPASNPAGYTSNVGTVTSVSGTGTVSGLSLSGTVTSAGSLTLGGTLAVTPSNFASQTANTVLAAPNGSAGTPTFRAIVAADIPTLNQNTTGTASNVTGIVAVANGGTGASVAATARSNLSAAASGANTDITSIALTTGTISATPTSGTDIVNKTYADSIASGINFHQAVRLATTAALPANTYNNGASGVGATLTANANGALTVDGVAAVVGNRILVKNEVAQENNGVYTVTQVGSAGTPYILTRATDFDSSGAGVDQIDAGDFFLVTAGSTLSNTSWVQQTPLPITVGTTALVFTQFAAPVLYTAGTGLTLAGTTFSITNTGVSASTYGSASSVPVLAINAQGQVTSASSSTIAIAASQITSGALAIANGGTGATSAATALTNLGAYPASNPSGFTSNTGTVTSVNLTAGTGVSVSGGPITASGSITVTNTAPDQVVSLTGAGATTVSGTYPNFTISSPTSGAGTVTSINVSGGTTGLTTSGGPVTTSGTITLAGTLNVANGGTGATTLSSGYVLKGNGTSAVSASVIYDNGTNAGVGTTTPQAPFTIGSGSAAASNPTYGGSLLIASQMSSLAQTGGIEFRSVNFASGYGHRISSPDLGAGNTPLVFERRTNSTSWTESARIDSSGRFIVGTTAALNNNMISAYGASQNGFVAQVTNNIYSLYQGFNASTSLVFQVTGGGETFTSSSFRGPIFYDSDNTAFYADMAGTSNFNQINLGDSTKFIRGGGSGQTILGTGGVNEAYIQVGGSYYSIWNAGNFTPGNYLPLTGGTLTGTLTIQNSNDAQLYLNGNGTSWAGISWADVAGSDFIWYNGANSTFAIGGGGSNVANKKLHINGGTTIGSNLAATAVATNGLLVETQVSAPIYYDRNDTSYYVDPASGTNLAGTITQTGPGRTSIVGPSNYDTRLGSSDLWFWFKSIDGNGSSGYPGAIQFGRNDNVFSWPIVLNPRGGNVGVNSYSADYTLHVAGIGYASTDFRAPIFYDSNNTGYYLDPASTSVLGGIVVNGTLDVRDSNAQFWRSTNGAYQRVDTRTEATTLSRAHWYGVDSSGGTSNFRHAWYDGAAYFNVTASSSQISFERTAGNTAVYSAGDFRAPIFYDSNNTSYYVDAASNSVLNTLTLGGRATDFAVYYAGFTLDANTMPSNSTGFTYAVNAPFVGPVTRLGHGAYDLWFNAPYGGGGRLAFRTRNGDTSSINAWQYPALYDQNVNGGGALYATVYYDQNNTAYYVNPESGSRLGGQVLFDGGTVIQGNGDVYSRRSSGTTGVYYFADGGSKYLFWDGGAYFFGSAGYTQSDVSMRAPIFYDSNNTGYYINPNGTSNIYQLTGAITYGSYGSFSASGTYNGYAGIAFPDVTVTLMANQGASGFYFNNNTWGMYCSNAGALYTGIFYDINDTGYYLDPNGTGLALKVAGNIECYARSAAWAEGVRVRVPTRATWGGIRFTRDEANSNGNWAIGFTGIDSTDDLTFWGNLSGSEGMRARLTQTGNFTATGNVTAYSDIRIKKDVATVTDALKLVGRMRGVTYTRKDTGEAGVGVIAQEMLEVMPQVVQQDGGAEGTLSVAYGNLVGVLIEAIKELEARVAELEGK